MAIIHGSVADETWQKVVDLYPQNPLRGLGKFIERWAHIGATERVILLRKEALGELEKLFGAPIESPEKLVEWVRGLKAANIGGVEVPLRENQRKQIDGLATHYKVPFAVKAKEEIQRALDQVLGSY